MSGLRSANKRIHGAAQISRRSFMSMAAGTLAAGCATSRAQQSAQTRPNIVVILADDMGFGDVACQNPNSKIPTPNLDRLAQQGTRFTDAHSPSAVCTPTRYGLLTGAYCWRTELKTSVLWPWDRPLIDDETLTLPEMLRGQGYDTACIGKWHLGWNWPTTDGSSINDTLPIGKWDRDRREPFGEKIDYSKPITGGPADRGFDYYFGDDVPNFPPYCFIENDRTIGTPTVMKPKEMFGAGGRMVEGWDLTKVMPALTEKSVEYIRSRDDEPYFLYMPLTAPHTPIAPTEEFIGKSGAHRYGDFVHEVDWCVGQVLAAIDAAGQTGNTLVIFTSDNGSPARDGTNMNGPAESVLAYGHNPSHIYRGIKTDAWDGGHRVPFIVRWPGRVPSGAVSDQLICLTDIMKTCAAITHSDVPAGMAVDSYNVLPALEGAATEHVRDTIVHHSINGMFAIRQGRWKLILGKGSGGWKRKSSENAMSDPAPGQLYDMHADPGETTNRYSDHPEIVERLTSLLEQYKREGRSTPA